MKQSTKVILIVVLILLIDQISKIYIKTHFVYGQDVKVLGDWFRLYFIENEGMAQGIRFSDIPIIGQFISSDVAKPMLTIFRLFAVGFIIYLIRRMIKYKAPNGVVICMALILAGAMGNIFDSVFYGKIFGYSTGTQVATMFPEGGGYAGWFHGNVVDMLYFPIIDIKALPSWIPIWGGKPFLFFKFVFNIADASISIGIMILLFFHRKAFTRKGYEIEPEKSTKDGNEVDETAIEETV